jgi:AcrR family transcriptional regulator
MTSDTPAKPKYHHGDLRAALLSAAEAELALVGIEGFSLRAVAKRAGVSHAAPAHHFGDAAGLLTALAAEGFRKFLEAQAAREARAEPDPKAQLIAAGLGYVDFALSRPTLFRLIFSSNKPDFEDPTLQTASEAAYAHLVTQVRAMGGAEADVPPVWAMAHGLADLLTAGRLKSMQSLGPTERDAALAAMLLRSFPSRNP